MQAIYSPLDTDHFRWTDDGWYTFDEGAAIKAARKQRDDHAKQLKAEGKRVVKFSLGKQLRTLGGIGSGKPQVEFIVPAYGLNAD